MEANKTVVYTHSADLPLMQCEQYFHSVRLFRIYEQTPRHKPFMVVAFSADGGVVAHMLAVVRYRWSWLPPYLYSHCRVFGEGDYGAVGIADEGVFGDMLAALTRRLRHRALYVEFSDLSKKMFGYKEFRRAGYFPVHWMSVYNSLHSRVPEERIGERMKRRVAAAEKKGVTTVEVGDEKGLQTFVRLVKAHNKLKPRRSIPSAEFFRCMLDDSAARLFVTKYKGHTIGCCACVYSADTAYVWHLASLRKTYVKLHPDAATVWAVIKHAHAYGYAHIRFMDVGLPFRKNPYRDFILGFGGKPVSTYRWFYVTIGWVNRVLMWIYRG